MHAKPVRIEPNEDRFDAEATVGLAQSQSQSQSQSQPQSQPRPEPPSDEPPAAETEAAPKPKKRKRRVLVLTSVVVVLLLAGLGGVAAMPKVSNRLGLPWAPNAPKGEIPKPAGVTRVLHGPDVNGVSPTKEGLASALKGPVSSADLGTLTGSVVDAATGDVLWEKNSGTPLTPASTTKILVVAAALLSLDHGTQLSTKIVQGADPGTVILVAGGDTSLTALPMGTDSPLYPGAAHVDDLVAQVKKAVGGKVSKVQLDVSLFKGPTAAPGWDPEDTAAGSTYMAPVVPVMADGGRTDPKNDHAPRVANPATALTQKIAQKLEGQAGGITTAPQGAKVLGEVKSPPLPELANSLLQLSDNMLADVLARQVAIAKGGEASFAGGAAATMDVLKGAGFDLTGVQLNDGSGLSELNKIPAKVLSEILAVAAAPDGQDPRTAKLRPLLAGLPVAGGSGTLADRYGDPSSAAGKGWVRGKTGTLSGVNTLAGAVLDTDGRMFVFALMSSGSDQDKGRAALDVVAATLHKCGCR
jgi:D-alanyl-D-alanine carboxypeptidase/D-alanyl-D-alanine-endopeptidase (penicillin-binding protein 4)